MSGFKQFLLRGNVIELAVAVVIGLAFGTLVKSFVSSFVTPLIGVFGGVPDFSTVYFTINSSKFALGDFINNLLSFLLIAAIVYFLVVAPVTRLMEATNREKPASKTRECPECLSEIPVGARRCAFCTAPVTAA